MESKASSGITILFLVGASAFVMRLLLDSRFAGSASVYVGIPFLISVLLFHLTRASSRQTALGRYLSHLRMATVVMLASSVILFEGFLCVLLFMPIYYFAVTLAFLYRLSLERRDLGRQGRTGAHLVPLLVVLLSLEGVLPWTYAPRAQAVTERKVVELSIAELKANMARDISFEASRPWLIALFPLPQRVEAGSLSAGDLHRVHFTYRRWFVTNSHQGRMDLLIEWVGDKGVRTRVIHNDSYLASYLRIEGTEVAFRDLGEGRTEVSLTLSYQRLLDPAWYFGPLQVHAMRESAAYLIESVITREASRG